MLRKLKDFRLKHGFTQEELANKANVARATVIKIENGEDIDVKVGTLKALASALNCRVEDFF